MKYEICVTRSRYGPKTTKNRLIDNETGNVFCGTHREVKKKIAELEQAWRNWPELAHNEALAPTYTIIRAK